MSYSRARIQTQAVLSPESILLISMPLLFIIITVIIIVTLQLKKLRLSRGERICLGSRGWKVCTQ